MQKNNKRKKIVINKKFQLKTAFSIIAVIYLVVLIITSAIVINIRINDKNLEDVLSKQGIITSSQSDILKALSVFVNRAKKVCPNLIISTAEVSIDLNKNKAVIDANENSIKSIFRYNKILLYILIPFVIVQGVLFFIILMRKTHKISGPIFILTRYIDSIISGKFPEIRALRKRDEFGHLHERFKKMAAVVSDREKTYIDQINKLKEKNKKLREKISIVKK